MFSERRPRNWLLQPDKARASGTLVMLHKYTQLGWEGGGILEHPWNESNWIQADYEIRSAREIESGFPGTAGGNTFQYEALGGEALMALKELNTDEQAGCGLCDFLSSGSWEVWAYFPHLPHRGTAGD